jgi:hypothetical protein|tara:strand:- start:1632 stop:1961 length:330 start_codon:yes stop_codon:yes gene_type:complete
MSSHAPLGTVRTYRHGRKGRVTQWIKTSTAEPGPLWEYMPIRGPALTMIADSGWRLGTVLRSDRWPQLRRIRRIDGDRVYLAWADSRGRFRSGYRPVRTLPLDCEEVAR